MAALQHSPLSAPDVIGRSDLANHAVAKSLRLALLDEHEAVFAPASNAASPPSSPSTKTPSTPFCPAPSPLPPSTEAPQVDWKRMHAERALQMAYQREYTPKEGKSKRARDNADRYDGSRGRGRKYGRGKSARINVFQALDEQQEKGEGKEGQEASDSEEQRSDDGCGGSEGIGMRGAQVLGVGVVGHSRSSGPVQAEEGYNIDLPITTSEHDWRLRPLAASSDDISADELRYAIGPYSISFASGLSVLSKEHPARVWNTLLHSLDAGKKPEVRYEFEPVMTDEGDDAYTCEMTVTRPRAAQEEPDQTDIEVDKVEKTTPLNVRTWRGAVALTKGDACNNVLREALLQGLYGWIRGDKVMEAISSLDELTCRDVAAEGVKTAAMEVLSDADTELPVFNEAVNGPAPQSTALNRLVAACKTAQETLSQVARSLTFSVDLSPTSPNVSCTLRLGIEPFVQSYTSPLAPDFEVALEAAATAAIECNVEAYLHWLPANISILPAAAESDPSSGDVDWREQLYNFCRTNDLRPPRITQIVNAAVPGSVDVPDTDVETRTTFKGKIVLDDEEYIDEATYDTVIAARQSIARSVFVDYFGQTPVRLAKREQDGYGGRGRGRGRGGRRGRY